MEEFSIGRERKLLGGSLRLERGSRNRVWRSDGLREERKEGKESVWGVRIQELGLQGSARL